MRARCRLLQGVLVAVAVHAVRGIGAGASRFVMAGLQAAQQLWHFASGLAFVWWLSWTVHMLLPIVREIFAPL